MKSFKLLVGQRQLKEFIKVQKNWFGKSLEKTGTSLKEKIQKDGKLAGIVTERLVHHISKVRAYIMHSQDKVIIVVK